MVILSRRHSFASALSGFVLLAVTGTAEASPIYFNPANGHYYTLTTESKNWQEAEAEAVAAGGNLVSITDAAEQAFIETTFLTGSNDRSIYWIGATDQTVEGTFVWTNGDPFGPYTNWNPGEPNNCSCVPGGEDYATINWHYGRFESLVKGTWNDTSLTGLPFESRVTQGIIEFDTKPVPEPATLFMIGLGGAVLIRRRSLGGT